MRKITGQLIMALIFLFTLFFAPPIHAQDSVTVLPGAGLTRIIPPGFYFQGLSAARRCATPLRRG
ncbi:MAG TPA: hypothetical protein VE863_03990 [Pyrinomonadaceae bacterium]|nr:hypothetical protein [Pyrinomonadaceae bacterium]